VCVAFLFPRRVIRLWKRNRANHCIVYCETVRHMCFPVARIAQSAFFQN